MTDPITPRLAACYTGAVHDVMRAMGVRDFTFPSQLRPLFADRRLAGPAFTIDGKVDPHADPHETLLAWTGLLDGLPDLVSRVHAARHRRLLAAARRGSRHPHRRRHRRAWRLLARRPRRLAAHPEVHR